MLCTRRKSKVVESLTMGQGGKPLDDHGWEDAQGISDEEQKELAKDIDDVIRQGALVAGDWFSGDRTLEQFLDTVTTTSQLA